MPILMILSSHFEISTTQFLPFLNKNKNAIQIWVTITYNEIIECDRQTDGRMEKVHKGSTFTIW